MSGMASQINTKVQITPTYWYVNNVNPNFSLLFTLDLDAGMYRIEYFMGEKRHYLMLTNSTEAKKRYSSGEWTCMGTV